MSRPPFETVHIDRIAPVADQPFVEGEWRPVRKTLGIRAFGTNAYVATAAGQQVIEAHDEADEVVNGGQQEELYFVHRGHATFTVGGETIDAPTGTYVFVRDPGTVRGAVAVDAGTTILTFGASPERPYRQSAWEAKHVGEDR